MFIKQPPCPLCRSQQINQHASLTFKWGERTWLRCQTCDLVFVEPAGLPSPEDEIAEYRLHENSLDDPGYVKFLQTFIEPMVLHLPQQSQGLDYGSGPVPVLAELLRRRGFVMDTYDPIFAPDSKVWANKYDFITSTEVFEHFHAPRDDIERVVQLLKPGAVLGIMTTLRVPARPFTGWAYIRERSHVSFYSMETIHWIAAHWSLDILAANGKCVFFRSQGEVAVAST